MSKARLKRIEEKLQYRRGTPGVYFLERSAEGFILHGKESEGQRFDTEKAAVDYFDTVTAEYPDSILIIDDIL